MRRSPASSAPRLRRLRLNSALCGLDNMNVFTTDHPLSSASTGSRARNGLASVLAVALVLCPFFLGFLWFTNLIGNQDTTDYTPDPFWQVIVSAAVDSVVVAFVAVALYRLASGIWREAWSGLRQR